MLTHDEMVTQMRSDPAVNAAYQSQAEEFALVDELLNARKLAGLTWAEVAERIKRIRSRSLTDGKVV